jgi:hypothetical protein
MGFRFRVHSHAAAATIATIDHALGGFGFWPSFSLRRTVGVLPGLRADSEPGAAREPRGVGEAKAGECGKSTTVVPGGHNASLPKFSTGLSALHLLHRFITFG